MTRREVLIVVNKQSQASARIGEYYRRARGIPKTNVCYLNCPTAETIDPSTYFDKIQVPVEDFLTTNNLRDRIKVIVTTNDVPLRINGDYRYSSVDSCLSLLFNQCNYGRAFLGLVGLGPSQGAVRNPYYASQETFGRFKTSHSNTVADAFPRIRDLAMPSINTIVAVGDKGLILRRSSGVWSIVHDRNKSFVQANFGCVFFLNSNEGWAASDNGRVIKTTDGGRNWTRIRGPEDRLYDIAFASSSEGWAVGQGSTASTQSGPLVLRWQGSWQKESTGLAAGALYSVSAPDAAHVWACGPNGVIIRRTGSAWTRLTNGVPNATYRAIFMQNVGGAYHGWAAGDGGIILRTTNGGDTWTQQTSGRAGEVSKIFALDRNHAWVTSSWRDISVLRTSNGGASWESLSADVNAKVAVAFASRTSGWAVGIDSATGRPAIFATADGGGSWKPQYKGLDTNWRINYLVCRLGGYADDADGDGLPDDVKAMIDKAVSPKPEGPFILDVRSGLGSTTSSLGDSQLREAYKSLKRAGIPVFCDEEAGDSLMFITGSWVRQRVGAKAGIAGYASWGSNDYRAHFNTQWCKPRFDWNPGAVAMTYVSSDGRTFQASDFMSAEGNSLAQGERFKDVEIVRVSSLYEGFHADLRDNSTGKTYSATASKGSADIFFPGGVTDGYLEVRVPNPKSPGSYIPLPGAKLVASQSNPIRSGRCYVLKHRQSLIADLLREGCSGAIANVFEPFLDAAGSPDKTFPKYASGYTWAESAYAGLRYLGWQEVVLGDPLMAPYAPVVKITLLKKGAAVAKTIKISATATDPRGVNRAELFIDGKSKGVDPTPPYEWTINAASYANGKHEIEVAAYRDTDGVTFRGYDYADIIVGK